MLSNVVQFKYFNSKGLHAIMPDSQVYFLSGFNDTKVELGDICEIKVTGTVCHSKRGDNYFGVYWVHVVRVITSMAEMHRRQNRLREIKQSYGKGYPDFVLLEEDEFVCGITDELEFETLIRKQAWGL